MEYSVAIRTLGCAGIKYQRLLNSLKNQTLPPKAIYIYIAKGYPLPSETIGIERYVYVDKGMVAQRALQYSEIETEYILFLDDDLEFPPDTISKMYEHLRSADADIVSPDILPNHNRPFLTRITMTLSGRMFGRRYDETWGYKVMGNAGYSYNLFPKKEWYISQTNAGACFLCKKDVFLSIQYDDERWLDAMPYAMGDDQVMYYKMFCCGYKQITWYNHNILHLDGGNNMSQTKERSRVESDMYFKIIFWYRFIFQPERKGVTKIFISSIFIYTIFFSLVSSLLRLDLQMLLVKTTSIKRAVTFLRSNKYHAIPKIVKSF